MFLLFSSSVQLTEADGRHTPPGNMIVEDEPADNKHKYGSNK